jgi:hypothetical protein
MVIISIMAFYQVVTPLWLCNTKNVIALLCIYFDVMSFALYKQTLKMRQMQLLQYKHIDEKMNTW